MLPIVFDQLFATTRTTTDISRSGHICVCRPRGKRLIMIFITNSVNCAMKTAASCNIPRAQLVDAKQTRPLSVLREGCGYARLTCTVTLSRNLAPSRKAESAVIRDLGVKGRVCYCGTVSPVILPGRRISGDRYEHSARQYRVRGRVRTHSGVRL